MSETRSSGYMTGEFLPESHTAQCRSASTVSDINLSGSLSDASACRISDGSVVAVRCLAGRRLLAGADFAISPGSTAVWLRLNHPGGHGGITLSGGSGQSVPANTDTDTYIQIYELGQDGEVTVDLRRAPGVALYE